jgi:predicted lactoylglutathione lyase
VLVMSGSWHRRGGGARIAATRAPVDTGRVELQLSMVVLEVRDLEASIRFYRALGLAIPDPTSDRPIVVHRMASGVSQLLTTRFASVYDPAWSRPAGGYQQLLEFFVGDDALVESTFRQLTDLGYHGRMPPTQTAGPFAAMVDDPDGNVVLLTSDAAASPDDQPS